MYEDFIIVPGDEIKSAKIQRGLVDIERFIEREKSDEKWIQKNPLEPIFKEFK